MDKKYYIVGTILISIGIYMLFRQIKKGNITIENPFSQENQDINADSHSTVNLTPPMEVPSMATPPIRNT